MDVWSLKSEVCWNILLLCGGSAVSCQGAEASITAGLGGEGLTLSAK